ncbi:zf-BED domain-containing protein [Tanacetum coccineum]|uniref:Zf-BED domain-containing protein n=1 Tax=Tanacetum coccineum TaxID=301880 RepID=A0ABQ5FN67_9ASTR
MTAKGRRSGKGVKEKQNSSSHDPVMVNDGVKRGTGTFTNNNVNVDQNALNLVHGLHASSSGTKVENADPSTCTIPINMNFSPITDPNNYGPIRSGPTSYAKVTSEPSRKIVNFRTLITPAGNRVDVVVPLEPIRAISELFVNTTYGFFLGKRVAYSVVANYVRNTWGKYGLVKSMLNSSTGLFFFQFSSMDGLDSMLKNDPWFIRNNPLILKKWNPDVNLLKEDVGNVPVWVKLHGVLVTVFSEDGLSSIATKLGTSLMLDSYTSDMCMQSWGRLFKTTSLDYSSSPEFDLFSDYGDHFEEEVAEAMGEPTMEEYMTITRINYESGNEKGMIELKGLFLIELCDNAFSGTNGEDAIEHIENFLEIVDSLNIPNISNNQLRVRVFPFSLTRAASKKIEANGDNSERRGDDEEVNEKPWTDDGSWSEPIDNIHHECNPLRFEDGIAKWPTCNWKKDEYCNTGDLSGFIRNGNLICYEDYEWYDTIEDNELKEEALINKRILEESKNVMEESSDVEWDRDSPVDEWKDYEHTTYIKTDVSSNQNTYNNVCQIVMDHCKTQKEQGWFDEHEIMGDDDDDISYLEDYLIQKDPPYYVNKDEERSKERRCKPLGVPYVKPTTCKMEKFEVIKCSFGTAEEFVAINEYGYNDWPRTKEDACHAYQDIFVKMDEGWLVTRAE